MYVYISLYKLIRHDVYNIDIKFDYLVTCFCVCTCSPFFCV